MKDIISALPKTINMDNDFLLMTSYLYEFSKHVFYHEWFDFEKKKGWQTYSWMLALGKSLKLLF